ncbi:hypothetical protein BaRGS_00000166 [Batillaria attramentaria]|uniref:Sugar phosphate exchanger 3 n=1 Tax=Batillaria attramentaria TaxID=370345 RepID=A0ABD0MAF5_9CAEN
MKKRTFYLPTAFLLTFCSFAFIHATRKTFSNVKTTMTAEWTPSPLNGSALAFRTPNAVWNKRHLFSSKADAEEFMGVLDATFMFAYAVGLYLSGFIADRQDLRIVMSLGMFLTAATVFVFGPVFEWARLYSKPAYVAVWVLNGLAQSTEWPSCIAVMGNWFAESSRGLVLGLWSACTSVGNVVGALMVSVVLNFGYEYAFLLMSAILLAGGVLIFFGLVPSPRDVGLPMPDEGSPADMGTSSAPDSRTFPHRPLLNADGGVDGDEAELERAPILYNIQDSRPKAIGFVTALLLPGVIPYALACAFVKMVNYSFFFWLPFYLTRAYSLPETTADRLSIWYDVGAIFGSTMAGFLSDRFHRRTIVVVPMLILAVPMLFVYGMADVAGRAQVNGTMLFCVGALISGVANFVSAAVSADLGRQKQLHGNSEALSTVTGIIDGTGCMGAAIGQVAVPYLHVAHGWQSVFYLFMAATSLTTICILPVFLQDLRDLVLSLKRSKRASLYTPITTDTKEE